MHNATSFLKEAPTALM